MKKLSNKCPIHFNKFCQKQKIMYLYYLHINIIGILNW